MTAGDQSDGGDRGWLATARRTLLDWLAFLLNSGVVLIAIVLFGVYVWTDPRLSWQGWFTLLFTYGVLLVLLADVLPPEWVLWTAAPVFWLARIITGSQALAGFSNSATVLVGAMFIVARAIEETGIVAVVLRWLLGNPSRTWVAQLRLLLPAACLSGFMNNSPLVAILIPIVEQWLRQRNMSTTKFMMPLSFAVILGGLCTSIGTSTSILIVGLAESHNPGFVVPVFEVGKVGAPAALLGIVYMVVAAPFLLPALPRDTATTAASSAPKHYTVVHIASGSHVIGSSLAQLGVASLPDLAVLHVRTAAGDTLSGDAIDWHTLQAGDVFACAGPLDSIRTLLDYPGLLVASDSLFRLHGGRHERVLVEAMLASTSDRRATAAHILSSRNAALVAFALPSPLDSGRSVSLQLLVNGAHDDHSDGDDEEDSDRSLLDVERLDDVRLAPAMTLLFETTRASLERADWDGQLLYSKVVDTGSVCPRTIDWRGFVIIGLFAGIIALEASSTDPFFQNSLTATAVLLGSVAVVLRVITWDEALQAVRAKVLLTIATSFALGNAMSASGAAAVLANWMVAVFLVAGKWGVLFGLYLITGLLTSVLPNSAVANIMWPIAQQFSVSAQVPLMSVVVILMLASSSSYATPVGYQTNLMVSKGYAFKDYIVFGLPLLALETVFGSTLCWLIYIVLGSS